MKKLLAIPWPAPSIPAPYRLYHAGCAKGGQLLTHSPDSGAYVGDYVYFANSAAYARGYLRGSRSRNGLSRRKRDTRLFVIDARSVPEGTLVVARRRHVVGGSVEDCFVDLCDLRWEFHALLDPMERGAGWDVSHCNGDCSPPAPVVERLGHLAGARVAVAGGDGPHDPVSLRAEEFDLLVQTQQRWGITPSTASIVAEVEGDRWPVVRHRFNSATLFCLGHCGNALPMRHQLRAAACDLGRAWRAAFTEPFQVGPRAAEPAHLQRRSRAMSAIQFERFSTGRVNTDGTIVLVPGAVPVLTKGWAGVYRGKPRNDGGRTQEWTEDVR